MRPTRDQKRSWGNNLAPVPAKKKQQIELRFSELNFVPSDRYSALLGVESKIAGLDSTTEALANKLRIIVARRISMKEVE